MTKPVAIYARYSSDLQNPCSIDDQIARCRQLLRDDEYIADIYTDAAQSGRLLETRAGLQRMMDAIKMRNLSAVLAEGLDRLSRDMGDIAHIEKLASYYDCELRTIAEGGRVNNMHIGFKGTMNAMFLKDHAIRTKRGHEGNIRRGKAAGGLAYGYCRRLLNDDGEPEAGLREIDTEQAAIVREIFTRFAAGESATKIAIDLNRRAVPTARGGHWCSSTIKGKSNRPSGILRNAQYTGKLIYNRMSYPLEPELRRRRGRINPSCDWLVHDMPELRIVPDDLFRQVHMILERDDVAAHARKHRRGRMRQTAITRVGYCACGGRINRKTEAYFLCPAGRYKDSSCPYNRVLPALTLYNRIIEAIVSWNSDDIANWARDGRVHSLSDNRALKQLEKDHASALLRLERHNRMIDIGLHMNRVFAERINKLSDDIVRLEDKIRDYEARASYITEADIVAIRTRACALLDNGEGFSVLAADALINNYISRFTAFYDKSRGDLVVQGVF